MRIWLVTIGEPLPIDGDDERLLRTGIVANMLIERGHDVTWWTSAFDHARKKLRCDGDSLVRLPNGLRLWLLNGGGYRRNISIARLRDHRRLAKRFRTLAPSETAPDIILCSLPSLELSVEVARYGMARSIPTVLDIRDLWPDVFVTAVPQAIQSLVAPLVAPMARLAREACTSASHIWGHAPGFVDWGLRHAKRHRNDRDRAFFFGYIDSPPSDAERVAAEAFWDSHGVHENANGLIVCFAGTLGHQFDIDTVLSAAAELHAHREIKFVFCGTGDRIEELKAKARVAGGNVVFAGWRSRAEIWTLLRRSSIGIAPYVNRVDFVQTIPNKAPEYLSGGLPIALSLNEGLLHDLLHANNCGFSYGQEPGELASALLGLQRDRERLNRMARNARSLFEQVFRADVVYGEMLDALEAIAHETKVS